MKGVVIGVSVSWWLLTLIAAIGVLTTVRAEASVNLPLHHWAYEAIERLTAMGVIDRAMVVPKPYSRKQAAKYVARAIERIRADQAPSDGQQAVAEPLLERLMELLRPELVELGALSTQLHDGRDDARHVIRFGGQLQVEGDAFSIGHGTVRLRENRMGQYYANGEQVQGDLWAWLQISDAVTLSADPKYISNPNALGIDATANSRNLYFQELNGKFTVANLTFQIGRSNLWWGPGYRGTLLMSDHHFPLDMIQLGSEEPFRLPWVLRSLGEWRVNTFLTRLNSFTDPTGSTQQAKLFGARVSWLPVSWLELGVTRLTQYGLAGQSFPRTILDAYTLPPNQPYGPKKVHELGLVDFRATIPRVAYLLPFPSGLQLYGELGVRDKWSQYPLPSRGAFLWGAYIPQLFSGDTMDLRIEYANTDLPRERHPELAGVWYNDFIYLGGDRLRGYPLGHWMGTDAMDFFVRSSRYLTESLQLGTHLDFSERGKGNIDFFSPATYQQAHERKWETGVDLTWWISTQVQLTVAYTYQVIKNPGQITSINPFVEKFASGVTSDNHLLWTNLAVQF